jgi:hypothetical protein
MLRHEWQILDNFKKFLSIKVIKIVFDSMLYETLKWPQITPFCISSKKNPRTSQELWLFGGDKRDKYRNWACGDMIYSINCLLQTFLFALAI